MSEFTPGPWLGVTSGQNHRAVILSEADNAWHEADSNGRSPEAQANAALIAAAPALYEALEPLVEIGVAEWGDEMDGPDKPVFMTVSIEQLRAARAALALARGEAR